MPVPASSDVSVAGVPVSVRRAGEGESLLVLHHETGNPGWLDFHDALAGSRDVILPTLPGWDGTARPEWARSVRDLAAVCSLLLDELGVGRCAVVGLGFGGYVAAEMAVSGQSRLSHLVLVNAMGLKPLSGEIRDQFLEAHADYVRGCFADAGSFRGLYGEDPSTEQLIAWDANREMTARTAWKPFLYSQTLRHLLGSVRTPSLVVRGSADAVLPADVSEQFASALVNAELRELAGAGHCAESDRSEALAELVLGFVG